MQGASKSTLRASARLLTFAVAIATLSLACLDGGGSDSAPRAQFSQDGTTGGPGTAIQFTDKSFGTVSSYRWDFGALGTRTDRDPRVVFPTVGKYSVELTVTGPDGRSTTEKPDLVHITAPPTAGFDCAPLFGFAPISVTCTDRSSGGESWTWQFGDGGSSSERDPTHLYTAPGRYTIEQTVSNSGGDAVESSMVEIAVLEIVPDKTGPAPLDVVFTADTMGATFESYTWTIDGVFAGDGPTLDQLFRVPGTYQVRVEASPRDGSPLTETSAELDFVVDFSPPAAGFSASPTEGFGPLDSRFNDVSSGLIDQWEWDFGDGNVCIFPDEAFLSNDPRPICDASSPLHKYEQVGLFPVTLTVTGPDPDNPSARLSSTLTLPSFVRVYLIDPSFELQNRNGRIAVGWEHLRPPSPTEAAEHLALSSADGPDEGMPSDGTQWASLDGLGTDGATPLEALENGIRQTFLRPVDRPVLEFDYTLLYSEPPASGSGDGVIATVSDGTTTVEIPGSAADTTSPYAGPSQRFPTSDSSLMRTTPRRTASINLVDAFASSTDLTSFTLTIRTGNADNDRRSPRAFVDHIRFVSPETPISASFSVSPDPVFVDEDAIFLDETCPDPDQSGCRAPTSWRWDFATQDAAVPPTASGSSEQDPSYRFERPDTYDVELVARLADQESSTRMSVDVLARPMADFEVVTPSPYTAPAQIEFRDLSTVDPLDAIDSWSWDFGGWGTSTLQNPDPVTFVQAGEYVVTLEITSTLGRTDSVEMTVQVE